MSDATQPIKIEVDISILRTGYSDGKIYEYKQKSTLDETTIAELRRKLDTILENIITETKAHHQLKIAFHDRQEFIKKELKRITKSDDSNE